MRIDHRQVVMLVDGTLVFDEELRIPEALDDLPRIGVTFTVAAGLEQLDLGRPRSPRDLPRPSGRRPLRAVDQHGHRPVRPLHPPPGARRPRRDPALHAHRRGRPGPGRLRRGALLVLGLALLGRRPRTARHHRRPQAAGRGRRPPRRRPMRGLGTGACGPDTLPEYRVGRRHLPLALDAHADLTRDRARRVPVRPLARGCTCGATSSATTRTRSWQGHGRGRTGLVVELGGERGYDLGRHFPDADRYLVTNLAGDTDARLDLTAARPGRRLGRHRGVRLGPGARRRPAAAVAELRRVVAPGGVLLLTVPFLYPVHDRHDVWRVAPDAWPVAPGRRVRGRAW